MATISVSGRDARVTSRNRKHAEDKLSKLAKYFDGISKIEATLGHSGDSAEVEVVITVPRGRPLVCRSRSKELYAAIDLVLDKAEIQLTKHKEKVRHHRTVREEGTEAGAAEESGEEKLEAYEDIVEKREFGDQESK